MMSTSKQVLFVQGGGETAHDEWDNKLVASLERALGPAYAIHYPRMPDEAHPEASAWKEAIARELAKLSGDVILVGHSIGAAILIDYLASAIGELERRVAGVFLIAAPFIGGGGWPSDDLPPTEALAAALSDSVPIHLYQGRDDETVPFAHVGMFAKAIPRATIRRLDGRNHQLNDDLSEVAQDIRLLGSIDDHP
jgi:predicted alpha/beta hydrolase family esterase